MSAYGNPAPYPTPDLERSALEGRIRVARGIVTRGGSPGLIARWQAILDQLLDHLAEVDARAASAALDAALAGAVPAPTDEEGP